MNTTASKALSVGQNFVTQFNSDDQQKRLAEYIPDKLDRAKFTAVVIRAVQEDPSLLSVDNKMSLFLACQRAAQDGLIPDKREGALIVYSVKQGGAWRTSVQWQPMISGLRKRLTLCGFDIRAEVVRENDFFDFELGDVPQISHKPPKLGQDRGEVVGAYAVATRFEDGKIFREVMDRAQLELVKGISKAGENGPWGKWFVEMCRKTVAKRLINWLPLEDDRLKEIIDRDNEQYDMEESSTPAKVQKTPAEIQAEARKLAEQGTTPEPVGAQSHATKKKVAKKKTTKKKVTKVTSAKPTPAPEPEQNETMPFGFDPDDPPPIDHPDDPGPEDPGF
jgi:recombination protein RecT